MLLVSVLPARLGRDAGGDAAHGALITPRADINLSVRLAELTKTRVGRDGETPRLEPQRGGTSERGADSDVVQTRAALDVHGRILMLMTHNTDLGDSFEREGDDPTYFSVMSVPGYAFGINTLLYAMSH